MHWLGPRGSCVIFTIQLTGLLPNNELSQNSPRQNGRVAKHLMLTTASPCAVGEKTTKTTKVGILLCIDQRKGSYTTTRNLAKVLRELFRRKHRSEAQLKMRVAMGIVRAPSPSATAVAAPSHRIAAVIHALQTHPRSRQRGSIRSTAAETYK